MVEVGIKIKVSSDFGDPKVARESRGSIREQSQNFQIKINFENILDHFTLTN